MKYSEQIKPISYLKANASKIAKDAFGNGKTYIITQNGEAKLAVMDIKEFERQRQKMALLKIIAVSESQIKNRKVTPLKNAIKELDSKISLLKKQWNTK